MKPPKKPIHGILLLDKPLGLSSNGALQRAKRLLGAEKAGHTGSLDPLASGMLPLCFGEATKLSGYLLDSDKYYRVRGRLGVRTNTYDAEGEIISELPADHITLAQLESVLSQFQGPLSQVPPMYSALKVQGQPLYKLARQGIEVERAGRDVIIHAIHLLEFRAGESFVLDVHCSKGTYIRSLVDDIGQALGCGAFVSELRRTAVAPYEQSPMVSLEAMEALVQAEGQDALQRLLTPLESAIPSMATVLLTTEQARFVRMGQSVQASNLPEEGLAKLFCTDQFMGIGEVIQDGRIKPHRLFNTCYTINSPLQ